MEITTNEISMISEAVVQVIGQRHPQSIMWMPEQWVAYIKALKDLKLSPEEFKLAIEAARRGF